MAFNIVVSCDNDFAQHTCVMLTSLLFHHPGQSFKIFLLVPSSFSEENKTKMMNSLSPWGSELEFLSVRDQVLSGLQVYGHVSTATYYRLYLSELLPANLKHALYLDSDIIVNDSIVDLLNVDISNYSFGAVPDPFADANAWIRSKICLNEKAHYLNAGVLLLNLDRWRTEKIGLKALEFCLSNPDSVPLWDQCAINHVIQGKFYVLERKWNFQLDHMRRISTYGFHPSDINEARSAAVIHFTSADKPWLFLCMHPMRELYFKYLEYTEWRGFTERDRTPKNILKRYLRVHFPATLDRVRKVRMLGRRVSGL